MTGDVRALLETLRQRPPRVTVVGDVILDRWVRGGVRRVSREAPVPVVDATDAEEAAGGAANTAVNLAALGARVRLISVLADDAEGRALLRLLQRAGVDTSGVVIRSEATTGSKTRIIGEDQILVRVDHAAGPEVAPSDRDAFEARVAEIDPTDTVVVCDYDGGLFDARSAERLAALPRPARVLVDAHDVARWSPLAPDVITPNAGEVAALLGTRLPSRDRAGAIERAAGRVLELSGAKSAVVTLDVDGTVAIEDGRVTGRTVARPAAEHQASGAGDTFAAALATALSLGEGLADAAAFAQRAADVVVSRPGTAVCTAADLDPGSGDSAGMLLGFEALRARIRDERARGRRVVFTNGCFDLIHRGHTTHLRQAKALGDVLVVALNDDESVARLKGPGRPVNPLHERAAVIDALGCVDYVTAFSEDSPVRLLEELRPEIYAKGGDYTPEMLSETPAVRAYGGEVRILDYLPAHSTSDIVNRIAQQTPAP